MVDDGKSVLSNYDTFEHHKRIEAMKAKQAFVNKAIQHFKANAKQDLFPKHSITSLKAERRKLGKRLHDMESRAQLKLINEGIRFKKLLYFKIAQYIPGFRWGTNYK